MGEKVIKQKKVFKLEETIDLIEEEVEERIIGSAGGEYSREDSFRDIDLESKEVKEYLRKNKIVIAENEKLIKTKNGYEIIKIEK